MKFSNPSSHSNGGGSPKSNRGFTLPEILIALAVFMLLLAGIVAANLFGLRMFQVNETKLSATAWSRKTFGQITDEIQSCYAVSVGNMTTNDQFVGLLNGEAQQGTAIEIQPTTNTANLIHYFVDTADQTFRRTEQSPVGTNALVVAETSALILADSVTNTMIFQAQDFSGNPLTNSQGNQIIHLTLEFYQPERFMLEPDHYRLETSVARRVVQ
jgi:prepilin-type N-terminal cleavage/methylation domain-containing protein